MEDNIFISKLRKLRGNMTQKDFAKKFGFTNNYYSQLETGKRKPTLEFLQKLCEVSGYSMNYWTDKEVETENASCNQADTDLTLRLIKLRIEIAQNFITMRPQDQEIIKSTLNAIIADIKEIEGKEVIINLSSAKMA